MPIWIARRGRRATKPTPSQAPATAATIMPTSVAGSTETIAMKISACVIVGSAWPTLSVPGIFSSATRPVSLKAAVVEAKEPTPSVSKKLATKPIAISTGPGRRPAGGASATRRSSCHQRRANHRAAMASAARIRWVIDRLMRPAPCHAGGAPRV
nr:hypothetical protein [Sphingopyxis macrogoltabida]